MARFLRTVLLLFFCGALSGLARAQTLDLRHSRFVLPNGLRVIVREDHRQPVVAVTLWYHVGAKDESPGRSGLAHLFEHLMFEGSEHSRRNFMRGMEEIGASSVNAVTNQDRTAFYEIVPKPALDYALWLESDRMGYLSAAIDQATLDAQRGIIQNEKRQGEEASYAISKRLIAEHTFAASHPYSRPVLGDTDDLQAASLADVRRWLASYYGPSNALLVLAGDLTAEEARRKVERYFGDLPPGPPVSHPGPRIEKLSGAVHQTVRSRVPQPRLYMVWNIPPVGSADADALDLVSDCLARGKSSRLSRALVAERPLAEEVGASVSLNEIAGQLQVEVALRAGADPGEAERVVREQLARFFKEGPSPAELARVRMQYLADFARRMDRLVGTGSVSDRLAQGEVLAGGSEAYAESLRRARAATPRGLAAAARRWLADGVYVLAVLPAAKTGDTPTADRPAPPPAGAEPAPGFPKLQRATLSSGLRVILAERHESPVVDLWTVFAAGFAADASALPGTASMTAALLDEGTATRSGARIGEELAGLGAEPSVKSDYDLSVVGLSAVRWNLARSVALYADLLARPTFPAAAFDRQKEQQLAAIQREQGSPVSLALRALGGVMGRPAPGCGNRFSGNGSPESLRRMTREDVVRFHQTWFRPNNATLVVVGDVTLAELTPLLERELAAWKPGPAPPRLCSGLEAAPARPKVYLVDRPGAQQSFLLAAAVGYPKSDPQGPSLEILVDALGANKSSRLNMDLREEKHWTYGVQSSLWTVRGRQPFITYTSVQRDRTKDALQELSRELKAVAGERPVDGAELANAKASRLQRLPGSLLTLDALGQSIVDLVEAGLPDDYYESLARGISALSADDLRKTAAELLPPERILWVVVGDRATLEPALREAGLGEVEPAGGL
ncbi:MAG: M16 family metallopeptidase [Thermoanaerobaculia bacterium]